MHARTKLSNLVEAQRLYFSHSEGLTDIELSNMLNVGRSTAHRYRSELNTVEVSPGRYTLEPTEEEVALARTILARAGGKDGSSV